MSIVAPGERRLHIAAEEFEVALLDELGRVYPSSVHATRSFGVIESTLSSDDAGKRAAIAFGLQALPRAEEMTAPSISAWAALLANALIEKLGEDGGPFRLHVFCKERPGSEIRARRCALVEEAALAALKKSRRRLFKSRVDDESRPLSDGESLAQLLLESPTAGFFSFATKEMCRHLDRAMSRFPGGIVEIPDDRAPPSRAYRKLLEALLRLGRPIAPGETAVDLGASPGGWTHVALRGGATVTAVDRSPLDPLLMSHENLRFVRGDAFKYAPSEPVDWLLSDVIAYPGRAIALLEKWLGERLCRRFVVTVKFQGTADYPEVERLKAVLEGVGAKFQVRRLCANKNEVTAFGEAASLE